jgi:hypothetical protein
MILISFLVMMVMGKFLISRDKGINVKDRMFSFHMLFFSVC